MEAVEELILIHHHAGSRVRLLVSPAARYGGGLIQFGTILLQDVRDAVGLDESADHAILAHRVLLLGRNDTADQALLLRADRPLAAVAPVIVLGQHLVRVAQFPAEHIEHELAVGGDGREEHHAVRLEGGLVELLHADMLRQLPRHSGVLLRADGVLEHEDDAEPRLLRGVLAGAVDDGHIRHRVADGVDKARLGEVGIQRHAAEVLHRVLVPQPLAQRPQDEAADVFGVGLILPVHGEVLCVCLGLHPRLRQLVRQILQRHRHRLAVAILAAGLGGDVELHITQLRGEPLRGVVGWNRGSLGGRDNLSRIGRVSHVNTVGLLDFIHMVCLLFFKITSSEVRSVWVGRVMVPLVDLVMVALVRSALVEVSSGLGMPIRVVLVLGVHFSVAVIERSINGHDRSQVDGFISYLPGSRYGSKYRLLLHTLIPTDMPEGTGPSKHILGSINSAV